MAKIVGFCAVVFVVSPAVGWMLVLGLLVGHEPELAVALVEQGVNGVKAWFMVRVLVGGVMWTLWPVWLVGGLEEMGLEWIAGMFGDMRGALCGVWVAMGLFRLAVGG